MQTIWNYLESLGYQVTPRPSKKTVHLVLESNKMNNAQKNRMPVRYEWSEKLDGVYSLVTIIPNGSRYPEVRHWGRSGKAQSNTYVLDERLGLQLASCKHPTILISEVTDEGPLAKLSGYLTPTRVNDSDYVPVNFKDNFHDILSVDEFINGESEMTYHYRQTNLHWLLGATTLGQIPSAGYFSLDEAMALAESDYFPAGKEGLVGRDIHKTWVAGARNESAIKVKEKLSFDVTVVGVCSGKSGSKYQYTLGKLVVAFRAFGKPEGELLEIPVSGMTDAQRDYFWVHPEEIVGQVVKMDAKSYTENGNLREPRFKEIRHDKESQFPVVIDYKGINEYSKGKARWFVHDFK